MQPNRPKPTPVRRVRRGNPLLQEEVHDPYRSAVKQRTPVRCEQCGATYRNGRWTWDRLPKASPGHCPACRRIEDHYPAGEVTLTGDFLAEHADDALRMIDNVARAETKEHPLHRLMSVEHTPLGWQHAPRGCGQASGTHAA